MPTVCMRIHSLTRVSTLNSHQPCLHRYILATPRRLGTLDVTWEAAWSAATPLSETGFRGVYQEVRAHLRASRDEQTVSFEALLSEYNAYPGQEDTTVQFMKLIYDDYVQHRAEVLSVDAIVCGVFFYVRTVLFQVCHE